MSDAGARRLRGNIRALVNGGCMGIRASQPACALADHSARSIGAGIRKSTKALTSS
jgi:hypothetical protein